MAQKDYYKSLGLPKGASSEDIKKAYRRLARKHHPDVNPNNKTSENKFKEISEAYDVLGDSTKRKNYDQYGDAAGPGIPPGYGPGSNQGSQGGFGGFNFEGGSFDFSDLFGGNRSSAATPQRGNDLVQGVQIDFQSAFQGTQVRIDLRRSEGCKVCDGTGDTITQRKTCVQCKGSGQIQARGFIFGGSQGCPTCEGRGTVAPPCSSCRGTGAQSKQENLTVAIPAGIDNGARLRVAGKGEAGRRGGPTGDFFLAITVSDDRRFVRKGHNLYLTLPISISEASLGCKVEIPTPEGTSTLKIPPGVQGGTKLRVKEQGMPIMRTKQRGDLYAEISILTPHIQDERSKELLRELGELNDQTLRDQRDKHFS